MNAEMLKAMIAAQAGEAALSILAGRCFRKTVNGEDWVTSDKRQGSIELAKDPQEQLWHFKWKNLMSGKVDLNLTIFPGSANWYHLSYVEDGTVYELRVGPSKHWFWLQEDHGDDEKKAEQLKEAHQKLRNILKFGAMEDPNKKKDDKKDAEGTSSQQQGATPLAPANNQGGAVPTQQDILKVLLGMSNPKNQKPDIHLMDLFEPLTIDKVLEDPTAVEELLVHAHAKLKDIDDKKEQLDQLKADLLSPQVQACCKTLTRVIRSGQAQAFLSEMKIEDTSVMTVRAFLEAMEGKKFPDPPEDDEKKDADGDTDMADASKKMDEDEKPNKPDETK